MKFFKKMKNLLANMCDCFENRFENWFSSEEVLRTFWELNFCRQDGQAGMPVPSTAEKNSKWMPSSKMAADQSEEDLHKNLKW